MKKESQKARGARDLLPIDMEHFRIIENAFIKSCTTWGYKEIRTPTLEYLHLFTSAGTLTPSMLNKVYSFLDWDGWSGERVVLRPDGTIPVARLFIENMQKAKDAKLFYIANVFSFESTGKENREKWQCGVECIGHDEPAVDVEMIALALEVLKKLGIPNLKIKLSHAGIIKSLLNSLVADKNEYDRILDQINHGNWQYLLKIRNATEETKNLASLLLNIKGKSTGFLENIKSLPSVSKQLKNAIDNLAGITRMLDELGFPYRIDISSTRNFEYYTGLNFQIAHKNNTVVSGGRYDDLLPLMGAGKVPACGFALYTDQLMKYISENGELEKVDLVGIYSDNAPNTARKLFEFSNALRKNGHITEINASTDRNKYRWTIDFKAGKSTFMLTDKTKKRSYEMDSTRTLLNTLKQPKSTG